MTPEMLMAMRLSTHEQTLELGKLSIEELEGILKTANGDMLQYFQDHPEKLKEKQERDRKKEERKEKKAWSFEDDPPGHKLQKKTPSKTEDNEAESSDIKKDMEKDEKLSPQDKIKKADAMGRELARIDMEKEAALAFGAGRLAGAVGNAAKAVGGAAKSVGGALKAAPGAMKAAPGNVGNFLKKDWQATKQQFSAGLKGEARPALAKTPLSPAVHHNAMQAAPAAAAARPGMSPGMKMGLVAGGAAAAGIGGGMAAHSAMDKRQQQGGMMRTASVIEKTALFGLSQSEKYMKAHNAFADEFNKPENVAKANQIHQEVLKKKYNTTQKDAPSHIWDLAFDEVDSHPHFAEMRDRHFKKFGKSPVRGETVTKEAAIEKIALPSFNQVNEATKIPGRVLSVVDRFKEPVGRALKAVGGKAHGAVKAVGNSISNIKDPILKGTAIGGVTGGIGGAVSGALDPKEDPYTGEKFRARTAFKRGLSGAIGGAATGSLFGAMGKTSSVQKLEKAAAGLNMAGIGSMAKNFVAGMKPAAEKAMGAVKPMAQKMMASPMAQKAVGAVGGQSMGRMVGGGAAVGAGLGAAKGLVAPGRDANGQQRSRLGAMTRGAVGGAALGAGAGAGAKALGTHLGSMPRAPQQMSLGI